MSVNVSYKKQSLFGILYLVIILIIIEGAIQVLEINDNENCLFVESDVYENVGKDLLIEMCKNYPEIKSEYNTYLNKGLPPGPINNPGIEAIVSAGDPIKTDYLYFVSNKKGRHIFNKTYKAHLRSKK